MYLDDVCPPPKPLTARIPNDLNDIQFTVPGPFHGHIKRINGPIWEVEGQKGKKAAGRPRDLGPDTPGAVAKMRIHVQFDTLTNRIGGPLVLSWKIRASRKAHSDFATLVAGLAGILASDIERINIDVSEFEGAPVLVTLGAHASGVARIACIAPLPVDCEMRPVPYEMPTENPILAAHGLQPVFGPKTSDPAAADEPREHTDRPAAVQYEPPQQPAPSTAHADAFPLGDRHPAPDTIEHAPPAYEATASADATQRTPWWALPRRDGAPNQPTHASSNGRTHEVQR